jgi:putative ABC transport system permease protein
MLPGLGDAVAQIPGVAEVDKVRLFAHDVLGLRVYLMSLSMDIYQRHAKVQVLEGHLPTPEERRRGLVAISDNFANRRKLTAGDVLSLETPAGPRSYPIAAVIVDYNSDQGIVLMDREVFVRDFGDARVDTFEVYLTPGASLEKVRRTITERFARSYDLFILSNQDLQKEARRLVGTVFNAAIGMEIVAGLLALLGVLNTLLASVWDRTREVGLLRGVGASREHVARIFTTEAALMGVAGGAWGVMTGAVCGFLLVRVVSVQATGWSFGFSFPFGMAAEGLAVGVLASLIAGVYPALRASRASVVEALAME